MSNTQPRHTASIVIPPPLITLSFTFNTHHSALIQSCLNPQFPSSKLLSYSTPKVNHCHTPPSQLKKPNNSSTQTTCRPKPKLANNQRKKKKNLRSSLFWKPQIIN
uniref:Uncharacterized protein n=1 Tax=Gossypium raimondii TaxID=29730 RepID=A0A0D2Q8H1_GOSRA|nr:hypothetical protein B456_002G183000 [Gossypium raimondii]